MFISSSWEAIKDVKLHPDVYKSIPQFVSSVFESVNLEQGFPNILSADLFQQKSIYSKYYLKDLATHLHVLDFSNVG